MYKNGVENKLFLFGFNKYYKPCIAFEHEWICSKYSCWTKVYRYIPIYDLKDMVQCITHESCSHVIMINDKL